MPAADALALRSLESSTVYDFLPCIEVSQQGGPLDGTDFTAFVEDDTNRLRMERTLRGQEARGAPDAGTVHIPMHHRARELLPARRSVEHCSPRAIR